MLNPDEEFKKLEIITSKEASFEAVLRMDAEIGYFKGHFPLEAVLPAVAIIDASLVAISAYCGEKKTLRGSKSAKFMAPVVPGMIVKVKGQQLKAGNWEIQWVIEERILATLFLETN